MELFNVVPRLSLRILPILFSYCLNPMKSPLDRRMSWSRVSRILSSHPDLISAGREFQLLWLTYLIMRPTIQFSLLVLDPFVPEILNLEFRPALVLFIQWCLELMNYLAVFIQHRG